MQELAAAMRRAPRLLRRLTPSEFLMLVQAPVMLPLVALGIRTLGLHRILGLLERRGAVEAASDARRGVANRLAAVVEVAAAYGPWPANCLQRSVVLWWYLQRRGIHSDLRIGVQRDAESGKLAFHAWIEYGGMVLNDHPDVRARYATFERVIAPRGGSFD